MSAHDTISVKTLAASLVGAVLLVALTLVTVMVFTGPAAADGPGPTPSPTATAAPDDTNWG
jgi:hypothetical protein